MHERVEARADKAAGEPSARGAAAAVESVDLGSNQVLARALAPGQEAAVSFRSPKPVLARDIGEDGTQYMKAREFKRSGMKGPKDVQASTGIGGFNVSYDPASGRLVIKLKGAVDFQPGIKAVGFMGFAFAINNQGTAPVQTTCNTLNARGLTLDQMEAAIAGWQWSAAEETEFMNKFKSTIIDAWKEKHQFHGGKRMWEDIGATVNFEVDVHKGAKQASDHMTLKTFKIDPAGSAGGVGVVNSFVGQSNTNTMTLNSTDVMPRTDIPLTASGTFNPGAATIANPGGLANWARTYAGGTGPRCSTCSAEITAQAQTIYHARVKGTAPPPPPARGRRPATPPPTAEEQARQRYNTLVTQCVANGMGDAATRLVFEYAGEGDTFDLVVGSGQQQVVAAHEAGHMFGLHDEYNARFGAGRPATGTPVDGNIGPNQNLPGANVENTDSMMSVGNAVKPQHYATFLEALKGIAPEPEWKVGPPQQVVPPGVDGPLPRPGGDPTAPPAQPATAVA